MIGPDKATLNYIINGQHYQDGWMIYPRHITHFPVLATALLDVMYLKLQFHILVSLCHTPLTNHAINTEYMC